MLHPWRAWRGRVFEWLKMKTIPKTNGSDLRGQFFKRQRVARASEGLGMAMHSLESRKLDEGQLLANRGW